MAKLITNALAVANDDDGMPSITRIYTIRRVSARTHGVSMIDGLYPEGLNRHYTVANITCRISTYFEALNIQLCIYKCNLSLLCWLTLEITYELTKGNVIQVKFFIKLQCVLMMLTLYKWNVMTAMEDVLTLRFTDNTVYLNTILRSDKRIRRKIKKKKLPLPHFFKKAIR